MIPSDPKEQLEELMPGVPLLGLVPQIKAWRRRSTPYLATLAEPQSPVAESYWALRTSLKFVGVRRPAAVGARHESRL